MMSASAAAEHLVVAGSGEDHVPAVAAIDEIGALSGRDRVGTGTAYGDVVSREGDDIVVACRSGQHVRLRRAGPDHAVYWGVRSSSTGHVGVVVTTIAAVVVVIVVAGSLVVFVLVVVLVLVLVLIIIVTDLRHTAEGSEGDGVGTVGHGAHTIRVGRRGVVRGHRTRGQFDHILGTQGPDDGVVAAVGPEDDAVGRTQRRNVDRVVAGIAIDGDGVEAQAGAREVAERR